MILEDVPSAATVELDIFSGRPNPAWPLTADQIQAVVDRVNSLETAPVGSLEAPLGYRGFVVRFDGDATAATTVTVQSGEVEITGAQGVIWARDADRSLERLLLDQGRPELPADLVQIVERSLDE